MKKAAIVFTAIAVLLSDIMCAVVAFAYPLYHEGRDGDQGIKTIPQY